jgi:hypothetical protein
MQTSIPDEESETLPTLVFVISDTSPRVEWIEQLEASRFISSSVWLLTNSSEYGPGTLHAWPHHEVCVLSELGADWTERMKSRLVS